MTADDARFLEVVSDAARCEAALAGWRRARRWSFVAATVCLALAVALLLLRAASLCGLFAGVSAINFAAAASTDLKIKMVLLHGRGRPPAAQPGAEGPKS